MLIIRHLNKVYAKVETDLEFDASKATVMALKSSDSSAGYDVPEHHLPISACTDDFSVLKANGIHRALMTCKSGGEVQRLPVPDADETVF